MPTAYTTSSTAVWTIAEGLAAGAECLETALDWLRRGHAPTCCCPPDHIGIRCVNRKHSKDCKAGSWGKAPWHPWGSYRDQLPSERDVRDLWRRLPNSNVGLVLGKIVRVDVDGQAGLDLWFECCGATPPSTVEFTSGRIGETDLLGRGLLFAVPDGLQLKTTTQKSLDIVEGHNELRFQGLGAQTVVPPSRHRSGTRYRYVDGHSPNEIEIAPLPQWLIDLIRVEPRASQVPRDRVSGAANDDEIGLALSALAALTPQRADDYDAWLKVGMALHSVDDGDEMLTAWEEWSSQSDKWEEGICAIKWESFSQDRQNGVRLGTLIHMAKQDGWTRPRTSSPSSNGQRTGVFVDPKRGPGHYILRGCVEIY